MTITLENYKDFFEKIYINRHNYNHGEYMEEIYYVIDSYYNQIISIKDDNFYFFTFLKEDELFLKIFLEAIDRIKLYLDTFDKYIYKKTPNSYTSNFKFTYGLSMTKDYIKTYTPHLLNIFNSIIDDAYLKLLANKTIDIKEILPADMDENLDYSSWRGMNILLYLILLHYNFPVSLARQLLQKEPSLVNCLLESKVIRYSYKIEFKCFNIENAEKITYMANICDFVNCRTNHYIAFGNDYSEHKAYLQLFDEYGVHDISKEDEILEKINIISSNNQIKN